MNLKQLYKYVYLFLMIPLGVFLLSWLDYGFAFIFGIIYSIGCYKTFKNINIPDDGWEISSCNLCIIAFIAAIWCFMAGIGYFYYQSFDYHFRNAVFRDLINYEWPIFYNRANTPMVYYMAFWLIPATITKFFSLFIGSKSILFIIGNVILFFYSVIGVTLVLLMLLRALNISNGKKLYIAILMFIFFSGLDIIGSKFFQITEQPFEYHLDWWATFIQYSSITTGMFWVFNQFIPIAMITLLIYNEKNIKNFGFLIALSLFFSPYPTAGIGIFLVCYAIYEYIKTKEKTSFIFDNIFSIQNIIGVFWLLPLIVLYFITNSEGMDGFRYIFSYTTPTRLIIFLLLEFAIYALIIFSYNKKNIFFYIALTSLIFIPFLRLDQQNNFCMRASIPAIIIMAICVIDFIINNKDIYLIRKYILAILLIVGSCTPIMEFYRGIHYTSSAGKINLVADEIYTLNQAFVRMPVFGWDANHQYTAKNYRDDFFWSFLAKRTWK